ncbi:unnamed protein product [Toxocara canis]|uniref:WD_REPEATS_REGION domain-containing protein n=1 Tax=Toxocara canis TaxID=6265 RepID=A0A183V4N1_TOXCA|nr:unnamed protein product [Toxocara canis]
MRIIVEEGETRVYEEESKSVGVSEVRCVCWAPCNHSMLLIVTVNSWQVFDMADLDRLFIVDSQETLFGGAVIDTDRVAIATSNGSVQLFQLPRSMLTGDDVLNRFGAQPKDIGDHKKPVMYAALQGNHSATLWPSPVTFYFDCRNDSSLYTVFRADASGHLSIWKLPRFSEAEVAKRFVKADVQKASCETSLARIWRTLASSPPSIIEMNDNSSVTATLYISAQGRLVLGRDDGSILIVYACEAISKQLLKTPAGDVSCRRLVGHNCSVSCLLYPHGEHPRYDMQLLVSASADFSVIVWNLNTGARLHRFCVQGGPILRLLIPPENCNERKRARKIEVLKSCERDAAEKRKKETSQLAFKIGERFLRSMQRLCRGTLDSENPAEMDNFEAQELPAERVGVGARILHTVCAIAGDNSAALLSLKENKCLLLATRQLFPIVDVRWRPLDDFILLKCEDDSVYVWQMDTGKM